MNDQDGGWDQSLEDDDTKSIINQSMLSHVKREYNNLIEEENDPN